MSFLGLLKNKHKMTDLESKIKLFFSDLPTWEKLENTSKIVGENLYRVVGFVHPESIGFGTFTFEEIGLYSPYTSHVNSDGKFGLILLENQIPMAICSFIIKDENSIFVIQIQSIGRNKKLFNQVDYPVWFLEILSQIASILNLQIVVQKAEQNKWRIENNPVEENKHVSVRQLWASYDGVGVRYKKAHPNDLLIS
jgi:hypothetical protein